MQQCPISTAVQVVNHQVKEHQSVLTLTILSLLVELLALFFRLCELWLNCCQGKKNSSVASQIQNIQNQPHPDMLKSWRTIIASKSLHVKKWWRFRFKAQKHFLQYLERSLFVTHACLQKHFPFSIVLYFCLHIIWLSFHCVEQTALFWNKEQISPILVQFPTVGIMQQDSHLSLDSLFACMRS